MVVLQLQLRPYQREAVDSFFTELDKHPRQLIVLPTGAGKTIVFGAIAHRYHHEVGNQRPILIIAHRSELLDQADAKLSMVWPNVLTGRIQGNRNEQLGDVLLASTQTLVAGRKIPQPGLVIYDECHHSRAEGALGVLERLGVFANGGPPLLGVTATPSRSDKTQLGDIFEHITYESTILQMIIDGYLVDVRGIKVSVPGLDLKRVRMTAGDYNAKDLSNALNEVEALDAVVEAVRNHAPNRKSIVFAVDVKHAQALAERFRASGFSSASIDGTMKAEERQSVLSAFDDDRLRILVNCQILTEGFDQPDVDCVVIARPTRSRALYTQMVGRGLRLHPSKADALVLDLTGASDDKSLQTFTRLMRTQTKSRASINSAGDSEEDVDDGSGMANGESVGEWMSRLATVERAKLDVAEQVAEAINLFANRTRYRWQHMQEVFAICYDDNRWAYLVRKGIDWWPLLELNGEKFLPLHDKGVSLEYAQGIAEAFLDLLQSQITLKDAEWRNGQVSPKQANLLEKYRVAFDSTWTSGMASDALTQVFARRKAKAAVAGFDPDKWRRALEHQEFRSWYANKLTAIRTYAQRQAQ